MEDLDDCRVEGLRHEGELLAKTAFSPEKVLLSKGLEIMLDAGDDKRLVTISSEEGLSGFLVATDRLQAQFLVMSPGLYSEEHVHDYGFIIYTMEGRWVLCSQGRRCLMEPGSVCGISAGVSTRMEAPFEYPARLLFLLTGGVEVQRKYEEYMRKMGEGPASKRRDKMEQISDLSPSHPARVFARSLGLPDL